MAHFWQVIVPFYIFSHECYFGNFLYLTDPQDPCSHDRDHHPWREQRNRQGARREAHPRLHRWLHPQEVPVNLPHAGVCKRMQTRLTKQLLSSKIVQAQRLYTHGLKEAREKESHETTALGCVFSWDSQAMWTNPNLALPFAFSLWIFISNRLPGNCAQIITWCFATPIHGLNWIGYYYPGTYDTFLEDISNLCATWLIHAPDFSLQEVHTRKVKVLKRPKLDRARLMEAHEESGGKVTDPKTGETISKPKYEPKVQESV